MSNYVGDLVRDLQDNFLNGETRKSEYVTTNLKKDLDRIDAYLESKHISGETDSQGREKPFFNIVTSAVNIWFRATDIDRKNIRIKATKKADITSAYLATILLQEWMRKTAFGKFLNLWGMTEASHLSSVVKFVEKGGELIPEVVSWDRLIVDPIDFYSNSVIERFYLTPAQLRKDKTYDQDFVEKLIDAKSSRKDMEGQTEDAKSEYIEIYEIHGELPLSYLTDKEEDKDIYQQQMHVISFVESKENGKYDDYTLYSGKESRSPYLLTSLLPNIDGSISLKGAVKTLFDTQWMVNHTAKTIKDQLDLASKLIFQTSDGSFVGRNVLTNMQNGDILTYKINQPLTQINNSSHDITALQSYGQQWQQIGNQATGISEAMLGAAPKSGTAWRQTEALLRENHSLFELMIENKGLDLETMMTKFVIPFIKKKIDTTKEISAILEDHQIKQIDNAYIPQEIIIRRNNQIKKEILSGNIAEEPDMVELRTTVREELDAFGNQRFIKPSEIPSVTWKKSLKDFEWDVMIEITGEQQDKQSTMSVLQGVFDTIADPNRRQVLQTEEGKLLFNKILNEVGNISPIELSQISNQQPVSPVGGSEVGAGIPQLTTQ